MSLGDLNLFKTSPELKISEKNRKNYPVINSRIF